MTGIILFQELALHFQICLTLNLFICCSGRSCWLEKNDNHNERSQQFKSNLLISKRIRFQKFVLIWKKDPGSHGRPDRTENPDRSGFWYVVRIFGPRFVGPVRGPDFRSGFYLVRYVVRNLVRTLTWSGTRYGFWSVKSVPGRIFFRPGPWSGAKFRKIGKIKGSF